MATKRPGRPVRGSTTGRPIMVLLDVLGQRWSLRILWELRSEPATFRALQERCDGLSPTVLNSRLADLRALLLIERSAAGYALTRHGRELGAHLAPLDAWSKTWAQHLPDDG